MCSIMKLERLVCLPNLAKPSRSVSVGVEIRFAFQSTPLKSWRTICPSFAMNYCTKNGCLKPSLQRMRFASHCRKVMLWLYVAIPDTSAITK